MGFIQELPDEKYDRKYGDVYLFKRLFGYIAKHDMKTFFTVLAWMILQTAANILIPYFIKLVITGVQDGNFDTIFYVQTGVVVLLYATFWLAQYRALYRSSILTGEMLRRIRKDSFDTLLRNDMAFYDENKSGKLVSRVTSDSDTISQMVQLTTSFMINILVMIAVLVLLFVTNSSLALITIAVVPILFGLAIAIRLFSRRTSKNWRKTIAILNANVAESISGIEVTKSFNQEKEAFERFKGINLRNYRAAYIRAWGMSIFFPLIETLFGVGTFLVLYYGGRMSFQLGTLDVATLYFFILMLNRFFMPLLEITRFFNQFEAGLAAVERIFSLMDSEPNVVEDPNPIIVGELKGKIDFGKMTFHYNPSEPLYKDFTLGIPAGQTVAIVGRTGAGKSTLVSLLARFYDVSEGGIVVDGTDIRKYALQEYRDQIGIVLQDNILFSGSIEENIRYGKLKASREEIELAAKNVYAWEFIQSLPNGLDTEVGEKGTKLSAGQKQLVAFARALLSDPRILILDEATAAIDAYTESLIQEALKVLLKGRTA
ncbi:MAG: ABC transporter ATP-binding protein, partial [Candidatus Heimdallarchaeota archaeon]|nr:ABC transporter ATP-binding protein [Candidatus Heimdallarchaeota archaeon]MCK4954225.1 ABC transporter ATP-binding protein [Candidatus Heimdallarchaeota archaeon]